MDIFGVLQMVGGLCLFLFGMETMGDGLKRASGSKLEDILGRLTSSVPRGVLLGAVVTAVIQSSSATTVMLVGFVNSGIMQLRQAIPVIMGANIGTTATAWLLSLTGVSGDSFLIQMMKPMSFSPILAAIAIVFMMFLKSEKKYNIGMVMIGFAVLMYGMDIMSSAVEPLKDVPEFVSILTMFSNPVLGVVAGALFTAAIQSSSASVGILQALCTTGAVTYGSAIPIIMGQNIGTCITAILSSIGANRGAKRVAAVHLSFNMIGTVLFLVIFYTANAIIHFDWMVDIMQPHHIAIVHSLFNVATTFTLVWFTKPLEALACKLVKETEEEKAKDTTLNLLEERFLETPNFAASQCRVVAVKMANLTRDCIMASLKLIDTFDRDKCDYVYKLEEKIDRYEDALGAYIVKLSRLEIGEDENRMLSMILHNIGDLERISDHAKNIAETAEELHTKGLDFSPKAKAEVNVFMDAVRNIVDLAVDSFEKEDVELATEVEPLEDVVDAIHAAVKGHHVQRLQEGVCTIEQGFILNDLGTNLERVADHCSNLAVSVIEQSKGGFDMHNYIETVKTYDADGFDEKFKKYQEKYALPL